MVETESRIEVTRAEGRRESGELLFHGHRVLVGEEEKILEVDGGGDCTTNVNCLNTTELFI